MVALAPMRLAKAMPCSTAFEESSDPSVGIRMLVYMVLPFGYARKNSVACLAEASR